MPSHASANPEIKQLYINGHFCYVFKFGIVTNGLGIIRHISFYNKNFMASHPDIVVEKKSDSPDEDKCVHDSKLLIPTLKDFFSKHPLINPKTWSCFRQPPTPPKSPLLPGISLDMTNMTPTLIYRRPKARAGKIWIIPSMKMVFRVVPMILLYK